MLTNLRIQNFKSWRDTGPMRFAPLTGFFGPNSSGKSSILQLLLTLKQTVESNDRSQVLFLGDQHSYIHFVTLSDLLYAHNAARTLKFEFDWQPALHFPATQSDNGVNEKKPDPIHFLTEIEQAQLRSSQNFVTRLKQFQYRMGGSEYGIKSTGASLFEGYEFIHNSQQSVSSANGEGKLRPVKFYGFPYELKQRQVEFSEQLSYLEFSFETLFRNLLYLGPLREYPKPDYYWSGSAVTDVGARGENTIQALLYSEQLSQALTDGRIDQGNFSGGRPDTGLHVRKWLRNLQLIQSFRLPSDDRQRYEVRVSQSEASPEVSLTEVGFGLSQILPVLTLCFYAPHNSILILEQPEIHLHPAVQAGLADVLVDVIKHRNVQIILESHSEHLLRRLQRRIAEEALLPGDVALYFTQIAEGESKLAALQIDEYGNINNWPPNFFGDEMGDLVAMAEAAMRRQTTNGTGVKETNP